MTPKPVCEESPPSSMFSVTGFLTFSVVAATSLANIISNINNNNNNNNDNNNNENQNDNNQVLNNTMAGERRKRFLATFSTGLDFCKKDFLEDIKNGSNWNSRKLIQFLSNVFRFCPEKYICNAALESNLIQNGVNKKISLFTTSLSALILSDIIPTLNHDVAIEIIQNATKTKDCSNIKCFTS